MLTAYILRASLRLIPLLPAILGTTIALSQTFPNKPIRVVTSTAGGSSDFVGRVLAPRLSESLGQPVIVDNRVNSNMIGDIVRRAEPDGHTILIIGASFWLGPLLEKMSYDPLKEFAPVILTVTAPTILVVNPELPAKSVTELIALAKAKPGVLNYAQPGVGSAAHIAAELFKSMAHVNIVSVPYKGAGPQITATLSNEVQLTFSTLGAVAAHMKAGRLRALAVCAAKPSQLVPELPTVAASGLPGFQAGNTNGIFAPAKTPAAIIKRLNSEIARTLNRPEVKDRLFAAGFEVVGGTPQEFLEVVKTEMTTTAGVIKSAGIRQE